MNFQRVIRVGIVEDQTAIREDLQARLHEYPEVVVVGSAEKVSEALVVIPAIQPDLLFLDVSLPDGSGFDILEKLKPLTFKIVFLTAYQEHALKAIKFGALDYLLKPLNTDELKLAIDKVRLSQPIIPEQIDIAHHQYHTNDTDRLVIHSQQYFQIVNLMDILFCHGDVGYTTFHLQTGKKVVASKHLKEYEDLLPANLFLRTHQSYLVNSKFIEKYHKKGYLVLKDGSEIPVSSRRKEFVSSFFK